MSIFAELRAGVATSSTEETRRLAARLAVALPPEYAVREGGPGPVLMAEAVAWMPRPWSYQVPHTAPFFRV